MQNLKWYLADLKSTGKNTIETVEKSLTDMFIRLVRIYPCLIYILHTTVPLILEYVYRPITISCEMFLGRKLGLLTNAC